MYIMIPFLLNTKKPTCAYKLQKFNQDQSCSVKVGRGRKKRGRREGWVILILSSSENQKHVSSILLKNIIQKYKSRSSSLFLSACLQVGGPQISILSDLFFWLHYMACGILVPWPGLEPRLRQWECQVLTTGPPGKSLTNLFLGSQSSASFQATDGN